MSQNQPDRCSRPTTAAAPQGATVAPPPLASSLTGSAKVEYEAGKTLYQLKDYANARIKFERAYDLSSDPRLLWNIAICERDLARYKRVLLLMRQIRASQNALLNEQDREQARSVEADAQKYVDRVRIETREPGATVFIDDELVGTTPLQEPALVDMGMRRIRISKPGFKEHIHTQRFEGGADVSLMVRLEKEYHRGRLIVRAGPNDLIALDGKVLGKAMWEGWLPSGGHTLRITAPGFIAHQSEVLFKDAQTRNITVKLDASQASGPPAWLWTLGGVALAGTAVLGAALIFEREPAVMGSIPPGTVQLSFGGVR
ncbi:MULTISPECIES: PEGA domain-containing protein [Sorangium]|uniref:PEGA domain-containing protein n=1 Tax=Sorangium cellulosum TaxID=56 RepID=A0A4P2R1I4_SORCE|nr:MULTISPECIES: PEGA domain-containing protein [Sorangium]AUX36411.1 hypothetical protein SOCE836_086180 [Sorangium cellulosum]WCQ95708.1 hypothetical protein NQZ70_08485 [Sorangium sp. Soce836]